MTTEQTPITEDAFLLHWDGNTWRDVFRLKPGQQVTVGRSASNRVVLDDDSCSRSHCELFFQDGDWMLRDLSSRNGTLIDGSPIQGDHRLRHRDIIAVGDRRLAFTIDLEASPNGPGGMDSKNSEAAPTAEMDAVPGEEPPDILHRTSRPEFLEAAGRPSESVAFADALARLYQLGLKMGESATRQDLTHVVLNTLTGETVANLGAILLVRPDQDGPPAPTDLQTIAYEGPDDLPYRRVSDNLSRLVLSSREAVLARDVGEDDRLRSFGSLGQVQAASVICAPIYAEEREVCGLIHLYSSNPDNPLDKNDLEFTVAVARQMAVALDRLRERDSLQTGLDQARNSNRSLRRLVDSEYRMIGDSRIMQELREKVALIAETDAIVLIRGESGCGKELIARNVHVRSQRNEGPFVCVNCAALNESLLESELFGHEKGAFTGATDRKAGRFEQADQGTLFLDEVGEMSPSIQAKFLRILEGHPFERVGGRKPIQVDVRVVAATNRDLEQAVEDGEFRKDLYFRLHVAEILATPLRQRRDDILPLAEFFLRKFVDRTGRLISGFTDDAADVLRQYSWPGNVRELQNTMERTVILCRNEVVKASDLQLSSLAERLTPETQTPVATGGYQEVSLADVERQHILETLDHTDWNKSRASQILGIERSTLDRKLKRYNVSRPG